MCVCKCDGPFSGKPVVAMVNNVKVSISTVINDKEMETLESKNAEAICQIAKKRIIPVHKPAIELPRSTKCEPGPT